MKPLDRDRRDYEGACHCGTVRFKVHLSDGLHSARRCTCTLCRMRGAIAVTAKADDVVVTAGKEALTLYQFNKRVAKHYFCSRCGIYPFHGRRSNPSEYGVNIACLEGLSPFDFTAVEVLDGQNHPSDAAPGTRKPGDEVIGVLRYEPRG